MPLHSSLGDERNCRNTHTTRSSEKAMGKERLLACDSEGRKAGKSAWPRNHLSDTSNVLCNLGPLAALLWSSVLSWEMKVENLLIFMTVSVLILISLKTSDRDSRVIGSSPHMHKVKTCP